MNPTTGVPPHRTPADEAEAVAVQQRLRRLVRVEDAGPVPGAPGALLAGVDVAYDDSRNAVAAAAVLLDSGSLAVVEQATAAGHVPFPYVPGLLAFRELPAVLEALGRLSRTPDLVVCDGYGLAHPRRFGLACHLGVLTGLPSIGVAKNPFGFRHAELADARGAYAPLSERPRPGTPPPPEAPPGGAHDTPPGVPAPGATPADASPLGVALRTQRGVKPVYVSVGHRTTLVAARAHTLWLAPDHRQPETTRRADRLCREALAEYTD